jgi:hypothetical protein
MLVQLGIAFANNMSLNNRETFQQDRFWFNEVGLPKSNILDMPLAHCVFGNTFKSEKTFLMKG